MVQVLTIRTQYAVSFTGDEQRAKDIRYNSRRDMTCCQPKSHLPRDLVNSSWNLCLKLRLLPFSLVCIWWRVVFCFVIRHIWVNIALRWQYRRIQNPISVIVAPSSKEISLPRYTTSVNKGSKLTDKRSKYYYSSKF